MSNAIQLSFYGSTGLTTVSFKGKDIYSFTEISEQDIDVDVLVNRKKIIYYRGIENNSFELVLFPDTLGVIENIEKILNISDSYVILDVYYSDGSLYNSYVIKLDQNAAMFYKFGKPDRESLVSLLFYEVTGYNRIAVYIPYNHSIGV